MESLRSRIRSILKEHGSFADDPGEIGDDADLYQLGMTSHASVRVMLALESAFEVEFPDRMLTRTVFENIASIGRAIEELVQTK